VGPASKELKSVAEAEKELAKSEVTHFSITKLGFNLIKRSRILPVIWI
jgi:hypothetical protein